jgi:PAS domain S-box-containing protein
LQNTAGEGAEQPAQDPTRTPAGQGAQAEGGGPGDDGFLAMAELSPDAVLIVADARIAYANPAAARLIGAQRPEQLLGLHPLELVAPGSKALVRERRHQILERGASFSQVEQRWLRLDGSECPVEVSAGPIPWRGSRAVQVLARDIADRKLAEARQLLLSQEVDHRARNVLALVQAVIRLSTADSVPAFIAVVEGRIAALAAAHGLLASGGWTGAALRELADVELSAFRQEGGIDLEGPAVVLAPDAVQPAAMILHELATNAAKHGALSVATGRVALRWERQADGLLVLDWSEAGGPPMPEPPRRRSGARMIEATAGQLGGEVRFDWRAAGLRCRVTLPADVATPTGRPAAPPAAPAPAGESSLAGRTVLVVEDDVLVALALRDLLQARGATVVGPAGTLAEAVGLAGGAQLDAAILDVRLHGREVWPVAEVLWARGIPYLLATGSGAAAGRHRAPVLEKPYAADRLVAALHGLWTV